MTIDAAPSEYLDAQARLAWTDFHTVLVVARHASVAQACVVLGMTHSTLLRKLDLIEMRLKTKLFERVRGRYVLTAAGHEIEQAASAFEPLALATEMRVLGQDLRPSGLVRVSVAPILLDQLLPPILAQFADAFPDVKIEFSASREYASLRRREADVAIRVSDVVPDWLVGRKLADLQFKIYQRRREAGSAPVQRIEALAQERRWIGFEHDAHDLKFDRWLANVVPSENIVLRVDNFSHALAMARAGLGVALLPCFVEASVLDLQALSAPIAVLQTPLWLITHPEVQGAMRIKVLMRAFGPALANAVQAAQD